MPDGGTVTHRTGETNVLGKQTEVLKAVKVDVETFEGLARLARAGGYKSRQEFMRAVAQLMVHGPEKLKSLHAARIDFVAGKLRESGVALPGDEPR